MNSPFPLVSLQNDLVTLTNESKKKFPEIAESAERLSYYLRTLKDKTESSTSGSEIMNLELNQTDEIMKPFILACESKNAKLLTIGISCIQKLLQSKSIPPKSLRQVLTVMMAVVNQGMELQLKILQSILPLISIYSEIHDELLADVFQICFKLQDSKFPVVSSTATATVRQLVVIIFDKISVEDKELGSKPPESSARPSLHDAIILLQDLCCLIVGEPPSMLNMDSLPKQLVLELLESIFTNHYSLVKNHELLASILKSKVAPLVIKQFSEKNDYPSLVRLVRVSQIFLKFYHEIMVSECKTIISLYIRLIEVNAGIVWPRSIIFEALRDLASDFGVLRSIFRHLDLGEESSRSISELLKIFQKCVFDTLGLLSTKPHAEVKDPGAQSFVFSLTSNMLRVPCLDQLDKQEAPVTPEFYIFQLIISAISSITDGLSLNSLMYVSKGIDALEQNEKEDYLIIVEFIKYNWSNIMTPLSLLLSAPLDDEVFTLVLNSLERLSIVVGLVSLSSERDTCIFAICKACIPGIRPADVSSPTSFVVGLSKVQINNHLTDRNVTCLKALINITNNLGSSLDIKSWVMVLDFLQCADAMITCGKLDKRDSVIVLDSSARGKSMMDNNFMSVMTSIKKLMDMCLDLKDVAYQNLVEALCTVILDTNLNSASSKEKAVEDKNFGVLKLQVILLANLKRFTSSADLAMWKKTTIQLINLLQQPNITSSLRSNLCSLFIDFVVGAIQFTNISEDNRRQEALLYPIQQLMLVFSSSEKSTEEHARIRSASCFPELQKCGLDTLKKAIETSGQNLVHGWSIIFNILISVISKTNVNAIKERKPVYGILGQLSIDEFLNVIDYSENEGPPVRIQLIRAAFPSMQLICNDFLSTLNASTLYLCIETLGSMGSQDADLNISLTAVGLLWTVSDHVLSRRQTLPDPDIITKSTGKYMNIDLDGPQTTLIMDALWISILAFLSILSSDQRPEVRNSACQTLFRSININGQKLTLDSWEECVLNILLPLIRRVQYYSENALFESGKEINIEDEQKSAPKIMVHHSRNSATKQWDETKILVLNGIMKVFSDFLFTLDKIYGLLDTTWPILLKYVHDWIVHGSLEVSLSSIKHLQILIKYPSTKSEEIQIQKHGDRIVYLWTQLWELWTDIAHDIQFFNNQMIKKHKYTSKEFIIATPSMMRGPFAQELLIAFLGLANDLYLTLKLEFKSTHLLELCEGVVGIIGYQTIILNSPENRYRTDNVKDVEILTPLQNAGYEILFSESSIYNHIDGYQEVLISTMATLITLPYFAEPPQESSTAFTFIALSKKCIQRIVSFLEKYYKRPELYDRNVFAHIIDCFFVPISKKYEYPSIGKDPVPLWKYAIKIFMTIIKDGLSSLDEMRGLKIDSVQTIYFKILMTMKTFLLFDSVGHVSPEDTLSNEDFDISVLTIIESEIVQYMNRKYITQEHIEEIVKIYSEGSQFYSIKTVEDQYAIVGVSRENFAKAALQLLFASCSVTRLENREARLRIAYVSAPVLVKKSRKIIDEFIKERKRSGKLPMPRLRLEELKLTLEYLCQLHLIPSILTPGTNLTDSLESKIKQGSKAHLFILYPLLVELLSTLAQNSNEHEEAEIINFSKDALQKAGLELHFLE